jgi:thiamine kinase-like enzyme
MIERVIYEKDKGKILELAENIFSETHIQSIERLGGMTNHTYRVRLNCGEYIFRISGEGTEELIDRMAEKICTELACSLDIDAKLLYFNEKTGVKITEYIKDAETMSDRSLKKEENLTMVAKLLKLLHTCGQDTGVPFRVFDVAKEYEDFIRKNNVCLFEDYEEKKTIVLDMKEELDKKQIPLVPCHNDPLCENWIRDKKRMYLVDWEYAGMNDALWDVADVSLEAGLDEREKEILLEAYFEGNVSSDDRKRYDTNKVFIDYLWSLWGLTRVPFDSAMQEYAVQRWERMKENMKIACRGI